MNERIRRHPNYVLCKGQSLHLLNNMMTSEVQTFVLGILKQKKSNKENEKPNFLNIKYKDDKV